MSSILSNLMILLSVAVVFAVMPLSNVNGQYRVTNYNYSHGLDIFSINRIAEDSSGYIWLGSKNGFSRFDGLEFKDILSEVSISESDIGAEVSDIKVDRKGRIWMSFKDAGVSYYDPVTKQFTVRDYSPTDGENFPSTGVSELHFDHNQENVWIHSVLEGIFLMDIKTLKCRKFIKMNRHQSMIPDKRNPDYIYFSDRSGVWHLNIKTSEKVKVFHKELYNMIQKENMLYGCSYSSFVHRVNLLDKTFKTVKHINKNVFKGFVFYKNELWISEIEGVYKLDFENKSVSKPSFVDPQGNSMELSKVMGLSCDHDENLWIGTISGVSVIYKDFQQLTCLDAIMVMKYLR